MDELAFRTGYECVYGSRYGYESRADMNMDKGMRLRHMNIEVSDAEVTWDMELEHMNMISRYLNIFDTMI